MVTLSSSSIRSTQHLQQRQQQLHAAVPLPNCWRHAQPRRCRAAGPSTISSSNSSGSRRSSSGSGMWTAATVAPTAQLAGVAGCSSTQLRRAHSLLRGTACSAAAAGAAAATSSSSSSSWCCDQHQRGSRVSALPLPKQHSLPQAALRAAAGRGARRPLCRVQAAAGQTPPDPWQQPQQGSSSGGSRGAATQQQQQQQGPGPTDSFDPWDAAAPPPQGGNGARPPQYEATDWGWTATAEDWDPAAGLAPEQLADMEADYADSLARRRTSQDPPRDKWITPLLDWQSVYGAFDPDQSRTEDAMADEALTNKEESREALAFVGRLVVIPLVAGALISKAITNPVLSFSLQNNPNAFTLTEHQKLEGAQALHMEETRVKMMMAIGQIPPLDEGGMLQHLHEYALEYQEEEREKNEANLMTLVSDSISAMVFFIMFVRDNDARAMLFSTIGRLFAGLSDIAKAVLIILVADTLLGYHSEEGWTGFLDLFLGHYGIEVEEENIVLFVGIIPIAIDVLFKYWIFIGLNKISPGAVVTIKQLDRH